MSCHFLQVNREEDNKSKLRPDQVCTRVHFGFKSLGVDFLMGCLPTKQVGRSSHSLEPREAVALAAETSSCFIQMHLKNRKLNLKEMVLALLDESDLNITSDAVEMIVDRTFDQADTKGDERIDQEEWNEFVRNNPYVLRNMTLPYLKDITMVFPSFVIHSEVSEEDMVT
uniref:Calcineurin B-like protein n=1 Tax=Leersia perrieri TaxID=77586 RepID=A0A0D9V2K8_9ORYZ